MNNTQPSICSICGSSAIHLVEIGDLRRTFCRSCHHSQRVDIQAFDYTSFAMGKTALSLAHLVSQAEFLGPSLPASPAILEIGCAGGHLATVIRNRHPVRRFDGIELSPAGSEAQKVMDRVFDRPLTALIAAGAVAPASYDVVLSSHCLEHIEDVQREIGAIRSVLSPQGVVFLEVPNRSGNIQLPFDDNRSHLHFFCVSSLTRLLAEHDLEVVRAETGVWYDARYSDSLRIVARPFAFPSTKPSAILSAQPILSGLPPLIVWGAGKMVPEMLAHYFDPSRIAFFVDSDLRKHGTLCMGVPVKPVAALEEQIDSVVLIATIEYESEIRLEIGNRFGATVGRVIGLGELLSAAPGDGVGLTAHVGGRIGAGEASQAIPIPVMLARERLQ